MRTPGMLLLLLASVATIAYPHIEAQLAADVRLPVADARVPKAQAPEVPPDEQYWRYANDAPFHDFLAEEVQQFASTDPQETAERICRELGGELGHMAPEGDRKQSLPFLCRFTEPDVTMSVDFGELHRILAP